MALFAAVVMFLAVIAAVVIVIISDNKKELAKANGQSKSNIPQEINRVYDGIPIAKCYLCGGKAVLLGKVKTKDILFNARCKDCGRILFDDEGCPDLGYVLNEWNKWNTQSGNRDHYMHNSSKGKLNNKSTQVTRY